MMRSTVVVIGGGISGLSVAWSLFRKGVEVLLFERGEVVGGTMQSLETNGWLVELGPNSALETTPLFATMFAELGIQEELAYANPVSSKRYVLRNDTLHPIPMSPGSFFRSRLWSASAKLRLLGEPFIGRGDGEESVARFVRRRLGQEFLDYAVNPFVAGVYAGDPEKLSVQAAFPKLYALEKNYGGLLKGMVKGRKERARRQEKAKDRAKMFSFRKGMQTFPLALARSLGDRVMTECEVQRIGRDREGTFETIFVESGTERSIGSDAVVISTPSYKAAQFLEPFSPMLANQLREIYYPPVTEFFLGFRIEQIRRPLDGFGFLVPEREQRNILGTIWSSSLFPDRAPAGCAALTTFVGGARQPEIAMLSDDRLLNTVMNDLRTILGINGEPVFTRITRWKEAIPQYTLGYPDLLKQIDRFERDNAGIFICSNFRGGISVGDCVMSSEQTAIKVREHLEQKVENKLESTTGR